MNKIFAKFLIKLCYFILPNNSSGLVVLNRLAFSKHVLRYTCFGYTDNSYGQLPRLTPYPFYSCRFDNHNRILAKLKLLIVKGIPSIESHQSQKYEIVKELS